MAEVKVAAQPRDTKGTKASRRLRREGLFPGIIYGADSGTVMVQVNEHDFHQSLHGHASEHIMLDLDIGGEVRKVLLQDVQHDPLTGGIIHADFHEVSLTEKLTVTVVVELAGEPVGVTRDGGILEHTLREIEIECLPADIPEMIEVDVSGLEIGDSLTVEDIKVDTSKIEVLTDADVAVASVAAPKIEEEPEAGEGEAGEGTAEPEVIGEKKDDEDEDSEEK